MGNHECSHEFFVCRSDTEGCLIVWHRGMMVLRVNYCPFCGFKAFKGVPSHDLVPLFKETRDGKKDK